MKKTLIILLSVIMLCISTSCEFTKNEEVANPVVIGEMAGHSQHYTVYIKENEEYIPYVVVTGNYNHNTLLLREEPLDEKMQMNKSKRVNYYPQTELDNYLNNTFIDSFSDTMQDIMNNTRVEVTTNDALNINLKTRGTEFVTRKIFLLSASEWGIRVKSAVKEGEKIENIGRFMAIDNEWLRTAEIWNYDTFWTVGNKRAVYDKGQSSMAVRPAFTVPFDTEVEQRDDVIEDEAVFVLKADFKADNQPEG
ncbi:MAG: DUF6273 domain-containing protein [Acutalibacteraceae bacterium]|nr:DUF6273 domain-containing protein [Acutalibacteraceae bacterium]